MLQLCAETGKVCRTKRNATMKNEKMRKKIGTGNVYRCRFCGFHHQSSKDKIKN